MILGFCTQAGIPSGMNMHARNCSRAFSSSNIRGTMTYGACTTLNLLTANLSFHMYTCCCLTGCSARRTACCGSGCRQLLITVQREIFGAELCGQIGWVSHAYSAQYDISCRAFIFAMFSSSTNILLKHCTKFSRRYWALIWFTANFFLVVKLLLIARHDPPQALVCHVHLLRILLKR